MWTAEDARKFAEETKYQDEIDLIDREIVKAVNKGLTSCWCRIELSPYVGERLEKLGYK